MAAAKKDKCDGSATGENANHKSWFITCGLAAGANGLCFRLKDTGFSVCVRTTQGPCNSLGSWATREEYAAIQGSKRSITMASSSW